MVDNDHNAKTPAWPEWKAVVGEVLRLEGTAFPVPVTDGTSGSFTLSGGGYETEYEFVGVGDGRVRITAIHSPPRTFDADRCECGCDCCG